MYCSRPHSALALSTDIVSLQGDRCVAPREDCTRDATIAVTSLESHGCPSLPDLGRLCGVVCGAWWCEHPSAVHSGPPAKIARDLHRSPGAQDKLTSHQARAGDPLRTRRAGKGKEEEEEREPEEAHWQQQHASRWDNHSGCFTASCSSFWPCPRQRSSRCFSSVGGTKELHHANLQ